MTLTAELPRPPLLPTHLVQKTREGGGRGTWLAGEGQPRAHGWTQPGRQEPCQMLAKLLRGGAAWEAAQGEPADGGLEARSMVTPVLPK